MAMRRVPPLFLLFGVLCTLASNARGHGSLGLPRAETILREPGSPDHILLRSDAWGMFRSTDGGETWAWICAEAWEGSSTTPQHVEMAMLPGGAVLVANQFNGLQISSSDDLCDFAPASEFEPNDAGTSGELVKDVTLAPAGGSVVYAVTSTGTADGITVILWESPDQGGTWSPVGSPLPDSNAGDDFAATNMVVAPSDSNRIYVAGKYVASTDAVVQRSDDAGQSWQTFTVPVTLQSWSARIHAVHPADPDSVYLWADSAGGGTADLDTDELWMSSDGAATWMRVFESVGNLPGFAISPDGSTVALGGRDDGLFLASLTDLGVEGPSAFQPISANPIWGLAWTNEGLYAGHDDFGPPRYLFGVSHDDGGSFSKIMDICDAEPIDCAPTTRTGAVCDAAYAQLKRLVLDGRCGEGGPPGDGSIGPSAPPDAGNATDATTPSVDATSDGGCGCRLADGARSAHLGGASGLLLMLSVLARCSRRRPNLQ